MLWTWIILAANGDGAANALTHPLTIIGAFTAAFGVMIGLMSWVVRRLIGKTIPEMQKQAHEFLLVQMKSHSDQVTVLIANADGQAEKQRDHDEKRYEAVRTEFAKREAGIRQEFLQRDQATVGALTALQFEINAMTKAVIINQAALEQLLGRMLGRRKEDANDE